MHRLSDVVLITAPSYRSRAYVQALRQRDLLPAAVMVLPGQEPGWTGPAYVRGDTTWLLHPFVFNPTECVNETFEGLDVAVVRLPNLDIHDACNIKMLSESRADILIYSGLSSVILREPVLSLGKRILHVHGGLLPFYRGSTTFYYSFLAEGKMAVSALWLNRKVDAGPILATRTFIPPKFLDVDRVVDPMARADLLSNVLLDYAKSGYFPEGVPQNDHNARLYYVIHPVLKHIALRRLGVTT